MPHYLRPEGEAAAALLAPVRARYEAARKAAEEAWRAKIEATPIDDAAWEKQLRWRAEFEKTHPFFMAKPARTERTLDEKT
jgi:hypothetical protein